MTQDSPRVGECLVEVKGITKAFGAIKAVDDISFEVRRGDVLGFLGPNGAGKTTAMKMLTGFLRPDSGRVRVAGHDMADGSLEARRAIGYLPENAPAYGEMSVADFLGFVAAARELEDAPKAVDRAIEMTELGAVRRQTVETLSKGFKRRVGLAQSLIHDPDVLILDEPTDGLDPNQKKVVQDLISGLASHKAIILSTHILDEAEKVCSRAIILSKGRIHVDSTPDELVRQAPGHNAIRLRLAEGADGSRVDALAELPWCDGIVAVSDSAFDVRTVDREDHLEEVLSRLEGVPITSAHLLEGRLDDLFREVTEGVSS